MPIMIEQKIEQNPINLKMEHSQKGDRKNKRVPEIKNATGNEALLQNMSAGLYKCDLQGNIVYYNKAAVKIWGREPIAGGDRWDATLQTCDINGNIVPFEKHPMVAAIKEGTAIEPVELVLLRPDGSIVIILAHPVPSFDESGNIDGATNVLIDITRYREKVHAILNRAGNRAAELEEANKELEAFNYTVSHDLQTPLRIIAGFSKILVHDYAALVDAEGHRLLDAIEKNAVRMSSLIKSLLAFSKLSKDGIWRDKVNMDAQVKQVIEEINPGDYNLNTMVTINQLGIATGDEDLVRQVWSNLICNAVKYSSKKEYPLIEIGVVEKDEEVVYYVKDNGVGFDLQNAEKLFRPFQRMHSDREFEGTGVGLATVHRIITKHGGRIWVDTKPNEGATFYFTL